MRYVLFCLILFFSFQQVFAENNDDENLMKLEDTAIHSGKGISWFKTGSNRSKGVIRCIINKTVSKISDPMYVPKMMKEEYHLFFEVTKKDISFTVINTEQDLEIGKIIFVQNYNSEKRMYLWKYKKIVNETLIDREDIYLSKLDEVLVALRNGVVSSPTKRGDMVPANIINILIRKYYEMNN